MRRFCQVLITVTVLLIWSAVATAAPRIAPGWTENQIPQYSPGSIMWGQGNVNQYPLVYRVEFVVPVGESVDFLAGRIAAEQLAGIYMNGQLVKEIAAGDSGRQRKRLEGQFTRDIDLSEHVRPGRNCIVISATKNGFALDLRGRTESGMPIDVASGPHWRMNMFGPLTIILNQPWIKPGFDDGRWFNVDVGDRGLTVDPAMARRIAEAAAADRLAQQVADARWRLSMLGDKGIAIRNWRSFGFGGAERLDDRVTSRVDAIEALDGQALVQATDALVNLSLASDELSHVQRIGQVHATDNPAVGRILLEACQEAQTRADAAWSHLQQSNWTDAAALADQAMTRIETALDRAADEAGLPLSRANEALFNKVGWYDVTDLLDADPGEWGLRLNPVTTSWKIDLAGKWRFRLDPKNEGLGDTVHTLEYNIENQWEEINVPGPWEKQGYTQANPNAPDDNPFGKNLRTDGPYNGYAWYRKTLRVPAEWAGHDLELVAGVVDDWDWAYFNGKQIGMTGGDVDQWWSKQRVYRIGADQVRFGQYNVIALRVYDCGAEGGIMQGPVALRCPGLKEAFEDQPRQQATRSTVYASPLSPAAIIMTGEKQFRLWGWEQRAIPGPEALMMVIDGKVTIKKIDGRQVVYDPQRDGLMTENWICLWKPVPDDNAVDLPILLVLESQPQRITAEAGGFGTAALNFSFDQPGKWLAAMRPIRQAIESPQDAEFDLVERLRFWSRAVLAYPMGFSEIAQRAGAKGMSLRITDVFDYRMLEDDWNTRPIRLAPLPPLASYGLQVNMKGLKVDPLVEDMNLPIDPLGRFMAVVDADRISYSVPIDPIPRKAGFTDFCFGRTDVGGPGNLAEVRIMRAYGCNSWRPQSNDGSERMHRTVKLANEQGLNLTINCDNRFAANEDIVGHYRDLARWSVDQDLPRDAIAFDLVNEPANFTPEQYNPLIKRIVQAIRQVDQDYLIYVETPNSYAGVSEFANLAPIDDPRLVYSFHDYLFRLKERWPNAQSDIREMYRNFLPAFMYSIRNNAPIHLGEFGGFHQTPHDPWNNRCTLTLMADFYRIFDQFGWHFHYYNNRSEWVIGPDGSMRGNLVHEAMARYFERGTFNALVQPPADGVTAWQRDDRSSHGKH